MMDGGRVPGADKSPSNWWSPLAESWRRASSPQGRCLVTDFKRRGLYYEEGRSAGFPKTLSIIGH